MKSAVGTFAMELLTQKTCSLHLVILVIDFFSLPNVVFWARFGLLDLHGPEQGLGGPDQRMFYVSGAC